MSARQFTPVSVRLPHRKSERRIASAFEALECLLGDWPITTGAAYRRAVRCCRDALDGVVSPKMARSAFVAAAAEIAGLADAAMIARPSTPPRGKRPTTPRALAGESLGA